MIEINGKPFLQIQLELLKKFGFNKAVLLTGFLQEQIEEYFGNGKKFGFEIQYVKDNQDFGTGFVLKRAFPFVEDYFLCVNGDTYLDADYSKLMQQLKKSGKLSIMSVHKTFDGYCRSNVEIENGLVKTYDQNARQNSIPYPYVDAGALAFKRESLQLIPGDPHYKHGQFFQELVRKKQLLAFEVPERFYDIGSFKELEEFRNTFSSKSG